MLMTEQIVRRQQNQMESDYECIACYYHHFSVTTICLQGELGEIRLGVSPDKPNVPVFIIINGGSPTKQKILQQY